MTSEASKLSQPLSLAIILHKFLARYENQDLSLGQIVDEFDSKAARTLKNLEKSLPEAESKPAAIRCFNRCAFLSFTDLDPNPEVCELWQTFFKLGMMFSFHCLCTEIEPSQAFLDTLLQKDRDECGSVLSKIYTDQKICRLFGLEYKEPPGKCNLQ